MVQENDFSEQDRYAQLAAVEVAGVIGVLCLYRNENGRLLKAVFNPLTEELAKRLELKKYKGRLAAQSQKVQQWLDSGRLDDPEWLAQNLSISAQDPAHVAAVSDALKKELKSVEGRHRLAQAFANRWDDKPVQVVVADLDDGVHGSACKFENLIELNKKEFNLRKGLAHIQGKTIPHEIKHLGQKSVPDSLNAREFGVFNGIVIEADARAAVKMKAYHLMKDVLQEKSLTDMSQELQKCIRQFLRDGNAPCSWDEFIALQWTNKESFNKIIDQCAGRVYENIFTDELVNQACSEGYIRQMIAGADRKGKGNLKALEAWIEDICQNGDSSFKMRKNKIWKTIENFATGEVEIPVIQGLFTKNGESLLPKDMLFGRTKNEIQALLTDPYEFAKVMELYYGEAWADRCHPELAQKFLEMVREKKVSSSFQIPDMAKIKEIQNLGQKLREKYPQISSKCSSMFGCRPFSDTETCDAKFQYSVYRKTSPEIVNDPDFIKWLELDEVRKKWAECKEKIPDRQRIEQTLAANLEQAGKKKKTSSSLPEKPQAGVGKALFGIALRWGATQAASYVGGKFKNTDIPEAKGAPLIAEQARWQTAAQQKANTFLAAGGITTATVGIILHAGSAAGAKFAATGAAKVGAKAIPVVGTVLGIGWAVYRAFDGDWTGVGLELTSAACDAVGLIPGAQPFIPAASLAGLSIDISLAVRDAVRKDGKYSFALLDENEQPIMAKDDNGNDVPAIGLSVEFKNGEREGDAVWYSIDSKGRQYPSLVGEYKNDKKHGAWYQMDANGRVYGVAHYEEGRLVKYKSVDKNGRLHQDFNFINGESVEYWLDEKGNSTGKIKQSAQFKDGKMIGDWKKYDSNGGVLQTITYGPYGPERYTVPGDSGRIRYDGRLVTDKIPDNGVIFVPDFELGSHYSSTPMNEHMTTTVYGDFSRTPQQVGLDLTPMTPSSSPSQRASSTGSPTPARMKELTIGNSKYTVWEGQELKIDTDINLGAGQSIPSGNTYTVTHATDNRVILTTTDNTGSKWDYTLNSDGSWTTFKEYKGGTQLITHTAEGKTYATQFVNGKAPTNSEYKDGRWQSRTFSNRSNGVATADYSGKLPDDAIVGDLYAPDGINNSNEDSTRLFVKGKDGWVETTLGEYSSEGYKGPSAESPNFLVNESGKKVDLLPSQRASNTGYNDLVKGVDSTTEGQKPQEKSQPSSAEEQNPQEKSQPAPAEKPQQQAFMKKYKTAEDKALERHRYVESTPGKVDDILERGSVKFAGRMCKKRENVTSIAQNNRKKSDVNCA